MGQTRINSEFAWFGAITRLKSRPALGCLQAAPSSALGFFSRSRFTTNGHNKILEARRRGGVPDVEVWYDDPRRDSFNVYHDR